MDPTLPSSRHPASEPAIRVLMMPRDTNAYGTIFGGVILSHLDQAGAIEAKRHTRRKVVTVAMREVTFKEPVRVGDLVSFYAHTVRRGRTSVTVHVDVIATRGRAPYGRVEVTDADIVFVAVDDEGKPVPLDPQPPGVGPGARPEGTEGRGNAPPDFIVEDGEERDPL